MDVKYSVIKLSMKDKIAKYLEQVNKGFHKEHSKANAKPWKLGQKGYYYKEMKDNKVIIVTED